MSDHEKGVVLLSPDSETAAAADSEPKTDADKTVTSPACKSKARHSCPTGKRSRFFRVFFSYLGALAVLIVVSLTLFWFYLRDYQRALPLNHGERIAQAYREGDAALLRQYYTNLPDTLQDDQALTDYLGKYVDTSDIFVYEGDGGEKNQLIYEISAGTTRLATLTLEETGEKSLFGFPLYQPVALQGHPLFCYTIQAPSGVRILLDGKPLDQSCLVRQEPQAAALTEADLGIFTHDYYEITDFRYIRDVQVEDDCGRMLKVDWDKPAHTVIISSQPAPDSCEEIKAFAIKALKPYLTYTTKRNASRAPALVYAHPAGSYRQMLNAQFETVWLHEYKQERYDDLQVDEFRQYSATAISCRIRMNFTIIFSNGREKNFPFDKTIYLSKDTGDWKIVAMENPDQS